MLNNTSSYYKPPEIDYRVMGHDQDASDFLNWCMQHRDNLEFMKDGKFMESAAMMVGVHFDHLKVVRKIEKPDIHKRP